MFQYHVHHTKSALPDNHSFLTSTLWEQAVPVQLENVMFNPNNPDSPVDFHSAVTARFLYDNAFLYGLYFVNDRYVRVTRTGFQQSVCKDSCVELFIRPGDNERYFNFEFSGGGAMLLQSSLRAGDKKENIFLPEEDCMTIRRYHTLPERIEPEITDPVCWSFGFAIPLDFFCKNCKSPIRLPLTGQVWHANFTKCSDETSHPNWLTWVELPYLNFHQPEFFGEFIFD